MVNQISAKELRPHVSKFTLKRSSYLAVPFVWGRSVAKPAMKCTKSPIPQSISNQFLKETAFVRLTAIDGGRFSWALTSTSIFPFPVLLKPVNILR